MATELSPILKVENISVIADERPILENVSFTVNRGDVVAIVGPNGAGKSTLFRALLDLISYEGEIHWSHDIKIGYVPQNLGFERDLPLTVLEFMGLGGASKNIIHDVLKSVGIIDHSFMSRRIGVLSGGEVQRVMIARALLGKPNVLLFDEPTSGVDISGEETIYQLLHTLQYKHDLTIILISHDLNVVYRYATKVVCLNRRRICSGVPDEVLDPAMLKKLYGDEVKYYHHHEHPHS